MAGAAAELVHTALLFAHSLKLAGLPAAGGYAAPLRLSAARGRTAHTELCPTAACNPEVSGDLQLTQSCVSLQIDNPEASGDSMAPQASLMQQDAAVRPAESFSAGGHQLQVVVPAEIEGEDDDDVSSPQEAAVTPVSHLLVMFARESLRQGCLGCSVVRQEEGAMSSCGQTDSKAVLSEQIDAGHG